MEKALILQKQNIDKNNFNIFIRDLSTSLNINLKYIIEDILNEENMNKKVVHKKGKKPVVKKKDIIIAEQNKKRELIKIKDDLDKIEFLFDNKDINNPFKTIKTLKTNEGIIKIKYLLLGE